MKYAMTLSLFAALAMVGCAKSGESAKPATGTEAPAKEGEATAAKTATVVLTVDGMT